MDDAKREFVQGWLIKSQHDLATARKLSSDPDPYLDTAIYHCQQTAEKAIKAFLVCHDQRFERTHDLRLLLSLATPFESKFSSLLDAAERLTPYATVYRYPGEVLEPDREEFEEAVKAADEVCRVVLAVLPGEVHPP